ncbi:FeoA domain-containing protein [Gluconobacter japonicus]|uniref:FeoA family protein n=1 Tax=Gluconobacter japonicus TaxID=376620 RepID=UPI0024ACC46F|nr:FeoA domain-containing protein [Gluconobacter japonicus]MDI6653571.1 FeoA domain-containing protein [Gluconobacter japonicus]
MKLMWSLDTLPKGNYAIIDRVEERTAADPISARLCELGFVPGESVKIVATGPVGADPIAVSLGTSRFALRKGEAARIMLRRSV